MNDKKSEQNIHVKHANYEKILIDELWIVHATFSEKKKNPSFKKTGNTALIIKSDEFKE